MTLLNSIDPDVELYSAGRDLLVKRLESEFDTVLHDTPLEIAYAWGLVCPTAFRKELTFFSGSRTSGLREPSSKPEGCKQVQPGLAAARRRLLCRHDPWQQVR
eukprot:6205003-Pleurochrysis_carterae.AAC.2